MSDKTGEQTPATYTMVREFAMARENPVLAKIRAVTQNLPDARMQISIEQGRLLAILARLVGTTKALEVGTFTGYSALCVAEVLPPHGKLVACDVSEEWTTIARRFWEEAGVADRIDLRLGPASETLDSLIHAGEAGTYDFAFVDADKVGYLDYMDKCLTLVRSGGVIVVDNMFLRGRTAETDQTGDDVSVVRELTERARSDSRIDPVLVTVSDGLLLTRKR